MRIVTLLTLGLLSSSLIEAADPAADLQSALAGEDFSAKRSAVQAVAGMPKDQDEQVLTLLVGALGDRQAGAIAADALRSRTGLSKPKVEARSGSSYPGHPPSDSAADWGTWLAAWKKDHEKDKKMAELDKKTSDLEQANKAKKDKDAKDGEASGEAKADAPKARTNEVQVARGPLVRVHFRNGSSKLYYMIAKRTDADGNLQSVRVAYLNDDGTEVLTADTIARLEEDAR